MVGLSIVEILTAIFVLHGLALLICGSFYGLGGCAKNPAVRTWVQRSAIIWLVMLLIAYSHFVFTAATCHGNFLYGYRDCTILPIPLADLSTYLLIFGSFFAIVYGTGLTLIATFFEWRFRRRSATDENASR